MKDQADLKNNIPDMNRIAAVCSTCGNCLYSCPVYNAEWSEPNSPRGKINLIKSLLDGRLEPGSLSTHFMYQCLLCGSCRHICPKGVEFVDMMVKYRNLLAGGQKIPWVKKIILFFYQSFLFRKFIWVVDILARTPLKKRFTIPNRLKTRDKKLFTPARQGGQYDILLFPGCVLTYFYPALIEKTVAFLKQQGFSVVVPRNLQCCGFPFLTQGWGKKFETLKKKNLDIFANFSYKYLVVPCSTGVMAFKHYYDFAGQPGKAPAIYELTEFIYQFARQATVNPGIFSEPDGKQGAAGNTAARPEAGAGLQPGMKKRITYHDPCHDLKILGIETEPRHFMKQFGKHFIDDRSALCCGFGGIFSVGFPVTAGKILSRKAAKLKELDVQAVVTSCPGCFMHMRENLSQDVKFFIEIF